MTPSPHQDLVVTAAAPVMPTTPLHEPILAIRHEDLVEDWLRDIRLSADAGQRSLRTWSAYRASIKPWLTYLASQPHAPKPLTVQAFLAAYGVGRKPATVNAALHAIRACYAWAETQNRYPSIARSVQSMRIDRDGPLPALPPATLSAAAAAAGSIPTSTRRRSANQERTLALVALRDEALIRCLFATGVRLVSMVRADVADVHWHGNIPTLIHRPKGPRGTESRAFLPPKVAECLRRYVTERERLQIIADPLWIAVGRHLGHRLDARSLRQIVTRSLEQIGIVQRDERGHINEPGVYSAHSIRRSATTQVVEVNGLEAGQIFAGHASADTTRRAYARVNAHRSLEISSRFMDLP